MAADTYLFPIVKRLTRRIIFDQYVVRTGFLLSLLFLSRDALSQQNLAPTLDYHLSWQGGSTRLNVRLDYTPATNDSTVFTFGTIGFGGQTDIFDVLKQIAGSPDDSISIQRETKKIVVHHHGSSLRQLTYQVDGTPKGDQSRAIYDELFRPVIKDGTLYVASLVFMVTPENHPAKKVGMQWDNVLKDMNYFLSYAPMADPLTKQLIPVEQSQSLLLVVGDDLITKKYQVGNVPYYFVASQRDTVNNVSTVFAPFFDRYFPSIRNYWNDYGSPYYYLASLPLLSTRNDAMSGGFAWGPGFIFKYGGKLDDSEEKVVAHEHAHLWIGQSITIGENSFSNQWFGEGFNDYVAIINLVHSGILTKSAFLDYVNKDNFNKHYTSSVRDSSNASIAEN